MVVLLYKLFQFLDFTLADLGYYQDAIYCIYCEIALMGLCGWWAMQKPTIFRGAMFSCLIADAIYYAITCAIYVPTWLCYIESLSLIYLLVYQLSKIYNIKSDKLSKKNVCILFYKSDNRFKIIDFIFGLFGVNSSSVAVCVGEYVYQLKHNKSTLQKISINNIDISKYIIIDTCVLISKIKIDDSKLLQEKARKPISLWLRLNCVRCVKPLLNQLGGVYSYRFMDWIAPVYLARRLKWKKTI